MLLKPGQVQVSQGAMKLAEQGVDIYALLQRHVNGDWGELTTREKWENDQSADFGFMVHSVYETHAGKLWIMTDADRSITRLHLPSEYYR
ncbi:MAG: hypothetical protein ACXABY_06785 [Candidatus Thorarchaeota archaeon]|jgi:hypothetical protein